MPLLHPRHRRECLRLVQDLLNLPGGAVRRPDGQRNRRADHKADKAKGVEFGSARDFLNSVRHQPWMVLHDPAMYGLLADVWGLGEKSGDGK